MCVCVFKKKKKKDGAGGGIENTQWYSPFPTNLIGLKSLHDKFPERKYSAPWNSLAKDKYPFI